MGAHTVLKKKKYLYLPYIHTGDLLHYYKAGDQACFAELLDNLRFILNRCKEYHKADFLFLQILLVGCKNWWSVVITKYSSYSWYVCVHVVYLISWLFFLVWNPELSIEVLSFGQKEATPIFLLNPWWGIYAHNNLVHPEDEYQIPGTNYNNPIIYNIIKWYNYWALWCELRKYKFKWWCDCCSCNSNLTNFKLT